MSDRDPDENRPDCPPDGVLLGVPPLPDKPDPADCEDDPTSTTPKPSQ